MKYLHSIIGGSDCGLIDEHAIEPTPGDASYIRKTFA